VKYCSHVGCGLLTSEYCICKWQKITSTLENVLENDLFIFWFLQF